MRASPKSCTPSPPPVVTNSLIESSTCSGWKRHLRLSNTSPPLKHIPNAKQGNVWHDGQTRALVPQNCSAHPQLHKCLFPPLPSIPGGTAAPVSGTRRRGLALRRGHAGACAALQHYRSHRSYLLLLARFSARQMNLQLQRPSSRRKLKDLLPAIERFIAQKCEVAQILLLEMRPPPLPPPDAAGLRGISYHGPHPAAPLICRDKFHLKHCLKAVIERQKLLPALV